MTILCPKCNKANDRHARFCQECGTDLRTIDTKEGVQQVTVSSGILKYAGFWRRLVAALIDGIILITLWLIIFLIFSGLDSVQSEGESEEIVILISILDNLVTWVYFAGMESSSKQATVGKTAIGIVVTDLNGKRISFGKATGRHFGKYISTLLWFFGFLMTLFTEKKQALHDMMAKCLVVKKAVKS